MAKQSDFDKFLSNIEPSSSTIEYISSIQNNLRSYLEKHPVYQDKYIASFLSGSYSKHTSIRPVRGDKKRDVDIIIVTNYNCNTDPCMVLQELYDVLLECPVYSAAEKQHHSVGIELSKISIDVVPVIQDYKVDGLFCVCDLNKGIWEETDPKGHKEWASLLNKNSNSAFKPLVKMFKWWRRLHCPSNIKFPKGITLEKIVADNLGDTSQSTEDLFIETAQRIIANYKEDYADKNRLPYIDDPSEQINNNLLEGYHARDFAEFIFKLEEHVELLNSSGTENETWRSILGSDFPSSNQDSNRNNYMICSTAKHRQKPVWQMSRGGAVLISLKVIGNDGNRIDYQSNGEPLDKGCSLYFRALTGIKPPFTVKWQITNTGDEARIANCLRGYFEDSDDGKLGKRESTSYTGSHSVQCFIIKYGVCVAKSRDYIINIK